MAAWDSIDDHHQKRMVQSAAVGPSVVHGGKFDGFENFNASASSSGGFQNTGVNVHRMEGEHMLPMS